jgi:hypothetical protein
MFKMRNGHYIKQYNPKDVGKGPQVYRRLSQPDLHLVSNRLLDAFIIIQRALIPVIKTANHQDR